jgi:hypothetical protein
MKFSHTKVQKALDWTPHPNQWKVIKNPHKEKLVCCGRRWGKSLACAYEVCYQALQPNQRIWIVAPSYYLTNVVFDQVVQWMHKLVPQEGIRIKTKPFPEMKLNNGTIIEGKSADAKEGMLGRSTNLVIIDEASRVDENIWSQYIKPTTHEFNGRVIYISTPTGINWFYDKFLELKKAKSAYQFSSLDNPYFPSAGMSEKERQDEWCRIRDSVPEAKFKQEYEAEFLTEGGLVFKGIHNIIGDTLQEPQPSASYLLGVDIARHEDFTALCVIDRATKNVVYLDRFREMEFHYQREKILTLAKKYNNAKIIIDSTGMGDSVASELKRHAFVEEYPLYSQKAKQQLIDKLVIFISERVIKIPQNEALINELLRYEVKLSQRDNLYKYSAPKGEHDDMVVALALAVWGLQPMREEDGEEEQSGRVMNDYES